MDHAPTILIIDDDVHLAGLMKRQLEDTGYDVVVASNGKEGLEKLKTIIPSLIVLDINMPQMNGLEFFRHIMADGQHSLYPVLVLTSRIEFESIFKDVNAAGFIPKPFLIHHLIEEVHRIIALAPRPIVFLIDHSASETVRQLTKILIRKNYDVIGVNSSTEFERITQRRKPRFILLECGQRDGAGEEIIKKIKSYRDLSEVPVVAYTYAVGKNVPMSSYQAGVNQILQNPQDVESFLAVIKDIESTDKG